MKAATGITTNTGYYFNVIVKDASVNKLIYPEVRATPFPYTTLFRSGNTGTITTSGVSFNGLTLNWAKATDDVTVPSSLQYEVRQSTSNNIGTVAAAVASGKV